MDLLHQALRAGHRDMKSPTAGRHGTWVAGGGGALGSAVLEALMGARALAPLRVLVTQDFHATAQGLQTQDVAALARSAGSALPLAVVVFDKSRHVNGREAAFWQPQPADLLPLATTLHALGVRHLIVVQPHTSASLPQALKAGLASLDEQAVAALGFDHVVVVRTAQRPGDAPSAGLQCLADAVLAQLRIMVPQREQPVRPAKVAALVAALARALPGSRPGTRVMAPEWVWQAAQGADVHALVEDWLGGATLPTLPALRMRM
jgi:hypothetical protein